MNECEVTLEEIVQLRGDPSYAIVDLLKSKGLKVLKSTLLPSKLIGRITMTYDPRDYTYRLKQKL